MTIERKILVRAVLIVGFVVAIMFLFPSKPPRPVPNEARWWAHHHAVTCEFAAVNPPPPNRYITISSSLDPSMCSAARIGDRRG